MLGFESIVSVIQNNAQLFSHQPALKFLTQKGYESLTYGELDKKIRQTAEYLQTHEESLNARAVIILPPGLDYVVALLACLYTGVIAVPVYPPRKNQHARRVQMIIENAQAEFVITHQTANISIPGRKSVYMDALPILSGNYKKQCITAENIAFIQYTSGSTSEPKGVLISHGNIMANLNTIATIFPGGEGHKVCSWLPPYHDMGLIGGILCPLFIKTELILMPPAFFLQSPIRWLEVISEEAVTMTVAPHFAFDLCAKKVTSEQLANLNLSSLQCVYNGSEPIHWHSLQKFIDKFSQAGLSSAALYLCYGLAEATLMLTVKQFNHQESMISLKKNDFELGKITFESSDNASNVTIMNCGKAASHHVFRIVDPETLVVLPEGEIGEVWARGASIAQGYWNNSELTQKTFANIIEGEAGHFLRTNDLGFVLKGDLYITGRLNDRMIIHGRNYYPQDIERDSEASHPAFEMQSAAAFTIEGEEGPQFILLQEVKRDFYRALEAEELFSILRGMLFDYGIIPYAITLVKPYSLPKTSSGKIRRSAAREAFLNEQLEVVSSWKRTHLSQATSLTAEMFNPLKIWLEQWLVQHLQIELSEEAYQKTLPELGLNSIAAVELSNDLQFKIGKPLELLPLFENHSLQSLLKRLGKEVSHATTRMPAPFALNESHSLSDLKNIYLKVHDGISNHLTSIGGKTYINYSGYNYLGLSGNSIVTEAVIDAVKTYGTSVSASRLVSGEKTLHRELENAISGLIGVEDCLVLPSGYSTNITIMTHLFGKDDLIIYDELSHNSILQGAHFSGAQCFSFPHNDYEAIANYLDTRHHLYRKILIVTEGIFSMDGDIPDIPKLITLKKYYKTHLMVDEAHSMGVLGNHGKGIGEYFSLSPHDIDIWMGTLSKSFASCGGYIAGSRELIENFKFTAAGFVYSAGISPANAAAALAAIQVMLKEPQRVQTLKKRHHLLLSCLKECNIPTGLSHNTPIIPIVVGKDAQAVKLSDDLKQQKILALPIIYPAVQKNKARVRLFVNCLHTEEQIEKTVHSLKGVAFAESV